MNANPKNPRPGQRLIWSVIAGLSLIGWSYANETLRAQPILSPTVSDAVWYNCLTREVWSPEKQAWCQTHADQTNAEAQRNPVPPAESAGGASRITVWYQCPNNRSFQVEYSGDTARLIIPPDGEFTLSQVMSASGARYSDGVATLYMKGNEAFVEFDGARPYQNCVGTNR